MGQSAAHKSDSPRRGTCGGVLGTPAQFIDGTLHTHVEGDTRTETCTEGSDEITRDPCGVERMRTTVRRSLQIIDRDQE